MISGENTVNVASRMESTGKAGYVQVWKPRFTGKCNSLHKK